MAKGIKACCRQQLAEREKTIRDLIVAGESKTVDGPILSVQLCRAYGTIDELPEKNAESDRKHETELASLRAARARELSQARSDNPPESGTGSTEPTAETGSGSASGIDQDGAAILTSPTASSTNFTGYARHSTGQRRRPSARQTTGSSQTPTTRSGAYSAIGSTAKPCARAPLSATRGTAPVGFPPGR